MTLGARMQQSNEQVFECQRKIEWKTITKSGGLCHCTIGAGKISSVVRHKTVNEIWYCLSGNGEIWKSRNDESEIKEFKRVENGRWLSGETKTKNK